LKTVAISNASLYRAITPRWAHDPLSGEGAATTGGRFNPVGYSALYLTGEPAAAIAEAQQSQLIMPPKTLCSYQISIAAAVDFSQGYSKALHGVEWSH
jgi:RES domain-containing protein